MDLKIIDKEDGDWIVNTGEFRLYHHQRDLMLEPGVAYKIKRDAWIGNQTMLKPTDDPLGGASKKEKKVS